MVLDHTKPHQRFFEEISQIPRETAHEKAISDYVVQFARQRGLWYRQDALWNVLIRKPASPGCEQAAPVILEAHMDMVCAKTPGSPHDFRRDPIELVKDGTILRAKDTSLGADDGFGVAYMLAVLDDETLPHPPLECVFTVQEEHKNNVGAAYFDVSDLQAKRIIGLDGDQEFRTCVGSVSSDRIDLWSRAVPAGPVSGSILSFRIYDLTGSVIQGVNHPECRNALKIAARMLQGLQTGGIPFRLCSLDGGTEENRDMEECRCVLALDGADRPRAETLLRAEFDAVFQECRPGGYTGQLSFAQTGALPAAAFSREDTASIVDFLYLMPNNQLQTRMQGPPLQALITTGIVHTGPDGLRVTLSTRAVFPSAGQEIVRHVQALARAFGFRVRTEVRYRSWPYNPDSPLRQLAAGVQKELTGRVPEEELCPGGLEVGWFAEKIPGIDILVLGATHENLHTTDEWLDLESFDRVYTLLCRILQRMTQ